MTQSETCRSLVAALEERMSPNLAKAVVIWACQRVGIKPEQVRATDLPTLQTTLAHSAYLSAIEANEVIARVMRLSQQAPASGPSVRTQITKESDIVVARDAIRQMAQSVGFDALDVVKIVTVVSELTRNIFQYAGTGLLEARAFEQPQRGIEVVASDEGPGIPNLDAVMRSDYRSKTGMGCGLRGSRNLVDQLDVRSRPGEGTIVTVRKYLPQSRRRPSSRAHGLARPSHRFR